MPFGPPNNVSGGPIGPYEPSQYCLWHFFPSFPLCGFIERPSFFRRKTIDLSINPPLSNGPTGSPPHTAQIQNLNVGSKYTVKVTPFQPRIDPKLPTLLRDRARSTRIQAKQSKQASKASPPTRFSPTPRVGRTPVSVSTPPIYPPIICRKFTPGPV